MRGSGFHALHAAAWRLARRQHGVITRMQLMALGFSRKAIEHRLADGRLHPIYEGVYVVGWPEPTRHGRWMAAVLRGGDDAVLSHMSAAALWRIRPQLTTAIEISIPAARRVRERGLHPHRRRSMPDVTTHQGIPVTTPAATLIDLAAILDERALEAGINEADKHDLITPASLVAAVQQAGRRPGARQLRELLRRQHFTATDSELERAFLRIVRTLGLPDPQTQKRVNGYRVDFYWPDLGIVVEADGGRFHRTATQQTRDRERDHAHFVARLTPLRFTHAQIFFDPDYVARVVGSAIDR